MAITSGITVVSDTESALNVVGTDSVSGLSMVVTNRHGGSESVDLGPTGVTDGAGFELLAGESESFDLPANDVLYAIAANGQFVPLHILRIGV